MENKLNVSLQHQKRQQKIESRVTLESLTSPSHTEGEKAADGESNDGENADSETNEDAPEGRDAVEAKKESEEDEDSVIDCNSSATSSASNRFTVLSEEQHSKDSVLDNDNISDMEQEGVEDTHLVSEMEKFTLDDAFIEDKDSDAVGQDMEAENDPPEAKEYTVVNQDPELAFHTLATRTPPEKQECSVQSCLFQFTEVEILTQNNSLLCVTCTKLQRNKDKAGGMWSFSPCYLSFVLDIVKA